MTPDLLDIAGIGAGANDHPDGTVRPLVGASNQATGGVVEDGAHVDLHVAPLVQGLVQQGHHILAFDPLAVEALSPPDQAGLRQALLSGFKVFFKKAKRKI